MDNNLNSHLLTDFLSLSFLEPVFKKSFSSILFSLKVFIAAWALAAMSPAAVASNQSIENLVQIPGGLTSVATGVDGSAWGLNSAGSIYNYVGGTQVWRPVFGNLSKIAVGNAGAVWGINSAGFAYHYVGGSTVWQNVQGTVKTMVSIAVGADGDAWGLDSYALIYHYAGGTWQNVPGALTSISVGNANSVWGINSAGYVYQFLQSTQGWQNVQGEVGAMASISAGSDGSVWALDNLQNIYYYNGGGASKNTITQGITHFGSGNSWTPVPGALAQISVGSAGNVWGRNAQNLIFHYVGGSRVWQYTPNPSVTQISANAIGDLWAVNSSSGGIYAELAHGVESFSAGGFSIGEALGQNTAVPIGFNTLSLTNDGNLRLTANDGSILWASDTSGQNCGINQCQAVFQSDGNFVLSNGASPIWSSGTGGNSANVLSFSTQGPPTNSPVPPPAATVVSGNADSSKQIMNNSNYVYNCVQTHAPVDKMVMFIASQPCEAALTIAGHHFGVIGADSTAVYELSTGGPGNQLINITQNYNFSYSGSSQNYQQVVNAVKSNLSAVTQFLALSDINLKINPTFPTPSGSGENVNYPAGPNPLGATVNVTLHDYYQDNTSATHWGVLGEISGGFLGTPCKNDAFSSTCFNASIMTHEILHNLGAPDKYGNSSICPLYTQTGANNDIMVEGYNDFPNFSTKSWLTDNNTNFLALDEIKRMLSPICDPSLIPHGATIIEKGAISSVIKYGNAEDVQSTVSYNIPLDWYVNSTPTVPLVSSTISYEPTELVTSTVQFSGVSSSGQVEAQGGDGGCNQFGTENRKGTLTNHGIFAHCE